MTSGSPLPADASRQSLAHGALGIALLHIERARRGLASWQAVHRRLAAVGPLIDGEEASLFLGAPAMAFVLHVAADGGARYAGAQQALDGIVAAHTRRRLAAAHARIDRHRYATFAEYDLLRGLTGLGALLLRRRPEGDELKGVLRYLVRLTDPLPGPEGEPVPGWWAGHAPTRHGAAAPHGHANAGLAHGITGPLALLALAKRRGITVPGHGTAMLRICDWLDRIRHPRGAHWPRWITATGPERGRPAPPSWCYGTPGLARAQQLAAIALGDGDRKTMAERALLACLSDPHQVGRLVGHGLCHGLGGLLRTAQRVAQEADDPASFGDPLSRLRQRFPAAAPPATAGLLEGRAGAILAFPSAEAASGPLGNWDACLLLS